LPWCELRLVESSSGAVKTHQKQTLPLLPGILRSAMFSKIAGLGREASGWGLLLLAVLLFPLPVLPTLLVIAGLLFLSARYSWASQLVRRSKAMLPAWFSPNAALPKNAASE
jgi:hypothetical protein